MEANRKESTDFIINFRGEKWHIVMAWMQSNGDPAWYDGVIHRDGVAFHRTFSPSEIDVPKITRVE